MNQWQSDALYVLMAVRCHIPDRWIERMLEKREN